MTYTQTSLATLRSKAGSLLQKLYSEFGLVKTELDALGETVDTLSATVQNSNLSATHKITRSATIVVAASDSSEKSKAQADYVCDGIDDQVEIHAAIATIATLGGRILLLEGHYTLSDKVVITANVIISGTGIGSTIVSQTGPNVPAFELGVHTYNGVQNLTVIMPTSNSGDGITVGGATHSTGQVLENLRFAGGTSSSYCIRITNAFEFTVSNIKYHKTLGMKSNGLLLENTANDYNYGNAKVSNVSLFCAPNTKGIHIVGAANKNYNLVQFSAINIISSAANGQTGIYIDKSGFMSFDMIDIELLDTAIYLAGASSNTFSEVYVNGCITDVYLAAGSFKNVFVSGNFSKITEHENGRILSHQNVFLTYPLSYMSIKQMHFLDDFVGANLSAVWRTEGTVSLSGGTNALLTTLATTGSTSRIDFGGNRGYKDDYGTFIEAKIKRGETGGYDVKFGLTDGGFAVTNIGAWWQQLSTGTTWQAVCCDGTALTTVDTGVSRSASAHVFSILKTLTGIEFYYDGVLKTTINTNRPGATVMREPVFEITTQEDTAHNLYVDSVLIKAGRLITP